MRFAILILIFVKVQIVIAQDPQLLDNNWYLHDLVIGGNSNPPPSNNEVPFVYAAFYVEGFETAVCDVLSTNISYNGIVEFTLSNGGMTFDDCTIPSNTNYEVLYLDNFYVDNIASPFGYTIVNEGNGSKTLTVTAITGDQAIYNTELLSQNEFTLQDVKIYPNPLTSGVRIELPLGIELNNVEVYNTIGQVIEGFEIAADALDLSNLTTGAYILKIHTSYGMLVKRIIKK